MGSLGAPGSPVGVPCDSVSTHRHLGGGVVSEASAGRTLWVPGSQGDAGAVLETCPDPVSTPGPLLHVGAPRGASLRGANEAETVSVSRPGVSGSPRAQGEARDAKPCAPGHVTRRGRVVPRRAPWSPGCEPARGGGAGSQHPRRPSPWAEGTSCSSVGAVVEAGGGPGTPASGLPACAEPGLDFSEVGGAGPHGQGCLVDGPRHLRPLTGLSSAW